MHKKDTKNSQTDPKSQKKEDSIIEQLQKDFEKAVQEKEEYLKLLQRERADFINFRKRIEEEKKEFIAFGQADMLLKIFPLYENILRALDHLPEELTNNEWAKGVIQIKELFEKTFTEEGVEKIKTIGEIFDSNKHEAMMQMDGEEGIVLQEFEAGYLFKGKVMKPAKVAVGNGKKSDVALTDTEVDKGKEGA